ncbi:hypothetical protein EJB05_46942, partial [Eragrostis curvula]
MRLPLDISHSQSGTLPSRDGLMAGAIDALHEITKSAPAKVHSTAFVVVVPAIGSGIVALVLPRLRQKPMLLRRQSSCSDVVGSPPRGQLWSHEKNDDYGCHKCCNRASPASTSLDLQTLVKPLLESLQSELQDLIATRLEEVVRPLREEASTIKLWLARVANHLERVQPPTEHTSASDMVELFGPCSPVRHSPTPSILTSLAAARTLEGSSVCEATCVDAADSAIDEMIARTSTIEFCSEKSIIIPETTRRTVLTEIPQKVPREQIHRGGDKYLHYTDTHYSTHRADVTTSAKLSIPLATIEDDSIQPTAAVKTEQQTDEPTLEVASSPDVTTIKDGVSVCPPDHPPSPPTNKTRRRRKSYDRSSLRQSARLAQSKVLKELSFMGNDGKLDEDRIQEYADCLKQLLPPDLLMSLMSLKDRDFWDVVAGLPPPLR